jgi:ABC-2 type transport system permease protein
MTPATTAQSNTRPSIRTRGADLRTYWIEARTECLKTMRLPAYVAPTLGFPAVFYVLFAVVLGGRQTGGVQMGTYMLATYGCFGVIGAALFAFGVGIAVERGQGWLLLKRAMPAPPGSWLAGKLAMSLLFAAVITLLLSSLAFGVAHVRMPVATWLLLGAVLVAGAIPFSAFGLALGFLCGPNSAPAVVNLIYLPMALLSGLWFPIEVLPKAMQSIAVGLPAYHYAQLALGVVGSGRGGPAWTHAAVLAGFSALAIALALSAYRRDEGATFG